MITPRDLALIANTLIDRHGPEAVHWADLAVEDLEQKGELWRADAWRALRSVIVGLIGAEAEPTIH